jgi:hypothetical protein
MLDTLARRYGCRPSAIARGEMLDFNFDLSAYMAAIAGEIPDAPATNSNRIEW